MLSEVFWVAFITTSSGMIIKLCSMAYKSKCKEIACCCIKIIRDVEAEDFSINRSNSLKMPTFKWTFIMCNGVKRFENKYYKLNLILCIL
jgi:hypothetical protein